MTTIQRIRDNLASAIDYVGMDSDGAEDAVRDMLTGAVEELDAILSEPTNLQGLALAGLLRNRTRGNCNIYRNAFDLPEGYWFVRFADGFECGIAPNGDVSS